MNSFKFQLGNLKGAQKCCMWTTFWVQPSWVKTIPIKYCTTDNSWLLLWSPMAAVIMICIKCLLGMAGGMSQTISDTVDSKRGQELWSSCSNFPKKTLKIHDVPFSAIRPGSSFANFPAFFFNQPVCSIYQNYFILLCNIFNNYLVCIRTVIHKCLVDTFVLL